MAFKDTSPVMLTLGIIVIVTALVTFGIGDIEFLQTTIDPIANWVFVGGFVGIYLISDREIGELEDYEAIALIVPIVASIGVMAIPQVNTFVQNNNPLIGIILVTVAMTGFYILSTDMKITYAMVQIILGIALAISAAVQYNVITLEILDSAFNGLTTWIFLIALFLAYMVSEREIGTFTNTEIGALGIGIGAYIAYRHVPAVETFITNSNPLAGILLTAMMAVAFYLLSNNGEVM